MDVNLEQVVDREEIRKILKESEIYQVLGDDVELWHGINVSSDGRNRFWKRDGNFAPDYRHNIMHLLGNQVNGIAGFSGIPYQSDEDRREAESLVNTLIGVMSKYLEEGYMMYKTGKINPSAKIFDFDNLSLFEDIVTLRTKLLELPDADLTNKKFIEKAMELSGAYVSIQKKYREDGIPAAKSFSS